MKKQSNKKELLTKEQKLALLEELLTELVNNMQMKDTLKKIILEVIDEISNEPMDTPSGTTQPEKKKGWAIVFKWLPIVGTWLLRFVFRKK